MANRFPLIVNSVDAKMYELASGDNLDLTGNGIYNNGATLVLPTVSGTLATLAGTETLTNKTISSGTLSGTFAGDHTYSGTITLSATSSLTIPVGTTAQRPTAATGQIRFNSSLTSFEGYNGTAWSSLGGVKSVDGFTYILAETSSGASNGELEFYAENAAGTAAAKQGGWNYTRLLTNTPVDFAGSTSGTTRVQATATASGTLTLPAATDTLVGKATTDTLTNKSINLANNTLTATSAQILAAVSDETGSGSLVFGTSPSFTTSVLTGSTTFNVFNTTATTVNAFGAATALSIGASTGTTTVNNNVVVTGNLTVNGTTTTINSTTMQVDDILVELGTVATPTDVTAAGGGIVLKGATDKTITWSTTGWTSSEDFNLVSGKAYEINGTSVLSATTLGSGVTGSSLTSVGTIGTGTWQGTVVAGQYGGTGVNNSGKTITLGGNLTTSGAFATTLTVTGATTVTLPTTGTLATLAGTETFTNKSISGATNTLTAIPNSALTNSTISGVALGGTLNSLTAGTGLSGTAYNGSAAQTWTLAASGVTAAIYGSSTAIPVLTVDTYGRITAATTTAISTTISLTGTTGTGSVAGGGTLAFAGSNGVIASVSGSTVTIGTPQNLQTTATPSFSTVTSTVATGTAPFTVTSTTKVANLNVEQVDGYHADTNNTASTIAVRDAQGAVKASGFNATSGIIENSATISANYTIASGNNAMSAGPVSIANGVTVTVPTGSVWTIV